MQCSPQGLPKAFTPAYTHGSFLIVHMYAQNNQNRPLMSTKRSRCGLHSDFNPGKTKRALSQGQACLPNIRLTRGMPPEITEKESSSLPLCARSLALAGDVMLVRSRGCHYCLFHAGGSISEAGLWEVIRHGVGCFGLLVL